MDLRHALGKVYAVILHSGHAHISAGCQRVVLLCDLSTARHLAQAENVPILALAKLIIEPLRFAENLTAILTACAVSAANISSFFSNPLYVWNPFAFAIAFLASAHMASFVFSVAPSALSETWRNSIKLCFKVSSRFMEILDCVNC